MAAWLAPNWRAELSNALISFTVITGMQQGFSGFPVGLSGFLGILLVFAVGVVAGAVIRRGASG